MLTKFRLARLQKGLTQTQLAQISGVKQPIISQIERGMVGRQEYMSKLQQVLGLDSEQKEQNHGE
jgi:transcriptional regulator with XRE-family HTH domain